MCIASAKSLLGLPWLRCNPSGFGPVHVHFTKQARERTIEQRALLSSLGLIWPGCCGMLSRRCLRLAGPQLTLQILAGRSLHCSQFLSGFGGQMNDEDPALLEAELKRYKRGAMALT